MTQFSSSVVSEPYRLYAVVQPASAEAAAEVEPNATVDQAQGNGAAGNYFAGVLAGPAPSADVDLYPFTASAGDLVFLGLDADPGYDATAINGALALLDSSGASLVSVNDPSGASSDRAVAAGTLTSTVPSASAEALAYRVAASGTYYARVSIGTASTGSTGAGDYLLSISKNCATGGGGISADLAVSLSDSPDPVPASGLLTYTITVSNPDSSDAYGVVATMALRRKRRSSRRAAACARKEPAGILPARSASSRRGP
jgi:hypothetical protein